MRKYQQHYRMYKYSILFCISINKITLIKFCSIHSLAWFMFLTEENLISECYSFYDFISKINFILFWFSLL